MKGGGGRSSAALWTYVALAFGLSYTGQIFVLLHGGIEGHWFRVVAPLVMLTPAVAAIAAVRVERGSLRTLLRWSGGIAPVLAGMLVPVVAALAANAAIHLGLAGSPPAVGWRQGSVWVPEEGFFLRSGSQGIPAFLANALASCALRSLQGGLLAAGEEIGWRGYLQPALVRRAGTLPGLALVGFLWALWHLPLVLAGYGFPDAPVLGALVLFPAVGVSLSMFLGWLRIRSGSVWPAVLAHGSYNGAFGLMVLGMDFGGRSLAAYGVIVLVSVLTGAVFAGRLVGDSHHSRQRLPA